ncbi:MAG: rhodanese-like domain-containing protein [Fimbriimonadaceae bacterium]
MSVPEVSPTELAAELAGPNPPVLVDVREADELLVSALKHAHHIPIGEIPARLDELDPDADLVIVCRSGGRSAKVTQYLLQNGFRRVRNLTGGVNLWAELVDPTMRKY